VCVITYILSIWVVYKRSGDSIGTGREGVGYRSNGYGGVSRYFAMCKILGDLIGVGI